MIIQKLNRLLTGTSILMILFSGCNGNIAPNPKKSKIKASLTNTKESAPIDPVLVSEEPKIVEIKKLDQPFILSKSYAGTNLIMAFPHPHHFGIISIREDDAKALYSTIIYKENEIKQMDPKTIAMEKRGHNISCFHYTFTDQKKDSGEKLEKYNCQFYIDYKNGSVVYDNDETILPEENVKELNESYLGNNLVLIAKHPASFGVISFRGEDAKALFDTLSIDSTITETSIEIMQVEKKEGKNVTCYREEHLVDDKMTGDYSCNFYLDYNFGSIREKKE